eukprot:g59535.t1
MRLPNPLWFLPEVKRKPKLYNELSEMRKRQPFENSKMALTVYTSSALLLWIVTKVNRALGSDFDELQER